MRQNAWSILIYVVQNSFAFSFAIDTWYCYDNCYCLAAIKSFYDDHFRGRGTAFSATIFVYCECHSFATFRVGGCGYFDRSWDFSVTSAEQIVWKFAWIIWLLETLAWWWPVYTLCVICDYSESGCIQRVFLSSSLPISFSLLICFYF